MRRGLTLIDMLIYLSLIGAVVPVLGLAIERAVAEPAAIDGTATTASIDLLVDDLRAAARRGGWYWDQTTTRLAVDDVVVEQARHGIEVGGGLAIRDGRLRVELQEDGWLKLDLRGEWGAARSLLLAPRDRRQSPEAEDRP